MKPETISLNLLIDVDASTEPAHLETLNALVDGYRSAETTVSLFLCRNEYQSVYRDRPIRDVGAFHFEPGGQAALYESACRMIDDIGSALAEKPESERPGQVHVVLLTGGRDHLSAPNYTKDALLARIDEQSRVYSWRFFFPGVPVEQFVSVDPLSDQAKQEADDEGASHENQNEKPASPAKSPFADVITLRRPVQKTSYQFSAELRIAADTSPERVFEEAVDTIRDWLDRKFPHSLVSRDKYFSGFDLDIGGYGQQHLNCIHLPDDGRWCIRLVHPDNPYIDHVPVTGRTWTTDMSIYRDENRVRFSLRVFCVSMRFDDPVDRVRPRIVPDLADRIGFLDGRAVENRAWIVESEEEVRELLRLLDDDARQLPVVLLLENSGRTDSTDTAATPQLSEIARKLFEKTPPDQSAQAFAHVVLLPEAFNLSWNGVRDDERCAIRICFPAPRNHVLTLPCDEWDGVDAIVAAVKEELKVHTATKKMNWGGCRFYNELRTRFTELRRKEIEAKVVEVEATQFFEYMREREKAHREEVEALKKDLEETYRWVEENETRAANFEKQLDKKKEEYYVLFCRLRAMEDRDKGTDEPEVSVTVSVARTVLETLEKMRGESKKTLRRLISRVGDPGWRQQHHHSFAATDLQVFKPGDTPERIAGFLEGETFYVTRIYDKHEEYEKDLPGRTVEAEKTLDFSPWTETT